MYVFLFWLSNSVCSTLSGFLHIWLVSQGWKSSISTFLTFLAGGQLHLWRIVRRRGRLRLLGLRYGLPHLKLGHWGLRRGEQIRTHWLQLLQWRSMMSRRGQRLKIVSFHPGSLSSFRLCMNHFLTKTGLLLLLPHFLSIIRSKFLSRSMEASTPNHVMFSL